MNSSLLWLLALGAGLALGLLNIGWLNDGLAFVAAVFTRLFQFLAVPTIALAVSTTLAQMTRNSGVGRIFGRTITLTLLTTLCSALVGLALYLLVAPDNIALVGTTQHSALSIQNSYSEHLLSVVPSNIVAPFAEGNVLSILLIAAAVGVALSVMPATEGRNSVLHFLNGLQELMHTLIRGLIRILPLGILAFMAQFAAQLGEGGAVFNSLGKYAAVILGGNLIQALVVLPLFLLLGGRNPLQVARAMSPAVVMAFFTKSSAATLPVTIQSAEERLGARSEVARFVLPICTTINMNGCAAFILVTSLFVMQHSGPIAPTTIALWVVLSVLSAVGNAGVPMGCYFLTLSLTAQEPASAAIMSLILPLFAVVDMVETAENVWSDSCVCALVDKGEKQSLV